MNPPIEEVIEDCKSVLRTSNCHLDEWTKEKMENLLQWYEDKCFFSQKQEEFLRKLWDKI